MNSRTTGPLRITDAGAGTAEGRSGPMDLRILAVYSGMAILLIAYIVSEIVRRDGEIWPAIDYWGIAAFEIVASLLCIARGAVARDARHRLLPVMLGLGLLCWSLGDVVVAAYDGAPPSPGLSDVFYIAFYPLTYVALMLLMRRQVRRFSVETWLDGGIAGLGAAALCAAFVFHGVLRATGGSTASVATNLAYPVGDLMLLILVVGGSAVLPTRRRIPWLMLSVGYALNAVGDTFNLFASGVGATHVGTVFNAVAWPASILLISASVWVRSKPTAPLARIASPGFGLPGVAAVAALVVVFASSVTHVGITALFLAGLTLAATGIRFGFSLKNLRVLTAERHRQAITDQLTALANRRALFDLLDSFAEEHADRTSSQEACLPVHRSRPLQGDQRLVRPPRRRRAASPARTAALKSRCAAPTCWSGWAVTSSRSCSLDADADYGSSVAQASAEPRASRSRSRSVRAQISASIGIAVSATCTPATRRTAALRRLAMYRAKPRQVVSRSTHEHLDERRQPAAAGRGAARRRRRDSHLELHYQPQLDLHDGEVVRGRGPASAGPPEARLRSRRWSSCRSPRTPASCPR